MYVGETAFPPAYSDTDAFPSHSLGYRGTNELNSAGDVHLPSEAHVMYVAKAPFFAGTWQNPAAKRRKLCAAGENFSDFCRQNAIL